MERDGVGGKQHKERIRTTEKPKKSSEKNSEGGGNCDSTTIKEGGCSQLSHSESPPSRNRKSPSNNNNNGIGNGNGGKRRSRPRPCLSRSHSWQGFDTAEAKRLIRQQAFWDAHRYDEEKVTDIELPPPPTSPPPPSSNPASATPEDRRRRRRNFSPSNGRENGSQQQQRSLDERRRGETFHSNFPRGKERGEGREVFSFSFTQDQVSLLSFFVGLSPNSAVAFERSPLLKHSHTLRQNPPSRRARPTPASAQRPKSSSPLRSGGGKARSNNIPLPLSAADPTTSISAISTTTPPSPSRLPFGKAAGVSTTGEYLGAAPGEGEGVESRDFRETETKGGAAAAGAKAEARRGRTRRGGGGDFSSPPFSSQDIHAAEETGGGYQCFVTCTSKPNSVQSGEEENKKMERGGDEEDGGGVSGVRSDLSPEQIQTLMSAVSKMNGGGSGGGQRETSPNTFSQEPSEEELRRFVEYMDQEVLEGGGEMEEEEVAKRNKSASQYYYRQHYLSIIQEEGEESEANTPASSRPVSAAPGSSSPSLQKASLRRMLKDLREKGELKEEDFQQQQQQYPVTQGHSAANKRKRDSSDSQLSVDSALSVNSILSGVEENPASCATTASSASTAEDGGSSSGTGGDLRHHHRHGGKVRRESSKSLSEILENVPPPPSHIRDPLEVTPTTATKASQEQKAVERPFPSPPQHAKPSAPPPSIYLSPSSPPQMTPVWVRQSPSSMQQQQRPPSSGNNSTSSNPFLLADDTPPPPPSCPPPDSSTSEATIADSRCSSVNEAVKDLPRDDQDPSMPDVIADATKTKKTSYKANKQQYLAAAKRSAPPTTAHKAPPSNANTGGGTSASGFPFSGMRERFRSAMGRSISLDSPDAASGSAVSSSQVEEKETAAEPPPPPSKVTRFFRSLSRKGSTEEDPARPRSRRSSLASLTDRIVEKITPSSPSSPSASSPASKDKDEATSIAGKHQAAVTEVNRSSRRQSSGSCSSSSSVSRERQQHQHRSHLLHPASAATKPQRRGSRNGSLKGLRSEPKKASDLNAPQKQQNHHRQHQEPLKQCPESPSTVQSSSSRAILPSSSSSSRDLIQLTDTASSNVSPPDSPPTCTQDDIGGSETTAFAAQGHPPEAEPIRDEHGISNPFLREGGDVEVKGDFDGESPSSFSDAGTTAATASGSSGAGAEGSGRKWRTAAAATTEGAGSEVRVGEQKVKEGEAKKTSEARMAERQDKKKRSINNNSLRQIGQASAKVSTSRIVEKSLDELVAECEDYVSMAEEEDEDIDEGTLRKKQIPERKASLEKDCGEALPERKNKVPPPTLPKPALPPWMQGQRSSNEKHDSPTYQKEFVQETRDTSSATPEWVQEQAQPKISQPQWQQHQQKSLQGPQKPAVPPKTHIHQRRHEYAARTKNPDHFSRDVKDLKPRGSYYENKDCSSNNFPSTLKELEEANTTQETTDEEGRQPREGSDAQVGLKNLFLLCSKIY